MGRTGQEAGKDGSRRLEEAKAILRRGRLCSPGWGSAGMGGAAGLGWGSKGGAGEALCGPSLTSLASFSYSSISFSFSWFTASTLQILLAAVSAFGGSGQKGWC